VVTRAQAQSALRTEQDEYDSGDEQRTDPGRSSGVEQGTIRRAPSTQQPDQVDQHQLGDQHEQDQSWSPPMIAPTVLGLPAASRQGRSGSGSVRRSSGAAASDPREMIAVGKISAMWQKVQPI
jgi:hypothetical protein